MDNEVAFAQLVVIGSSAGGIDALSTLVATLTPEFPAPIVIAQHLDPQRPSHLAGILERRCPLPVHTMFDQEHLAPGNIYVVPPDRHVRIDDRSITLLKDGAARPKPSINLLFNTAAQIFSDRLIAVILSGTGSDGAAGALEVKKAGGTVVIQNPDTALYGAMPRALAPTSVDFVVNVEEIGPLLQDLLTRSQVPEQPSEAKMLQTFLRQLHERSGLDFTSYKRPTILRRLQRRMVATSTHSIATYMRYLQQHPDEYPRLISSFLIKVTEFFRDQDLFTTLREQILPELITAARQHGDELRIWSAGCATGEEAYSLGILVAELLGSELDQFVVRIFATDLDTDAITFARRGVFPASALAGMPPTLVERYFLKVDDDYEIQKRIRSLVIFGLHDLGQRAPFPRIDLVLCRNVLIYFTQELQKRVLQLFAYSLRDGGYLALGKAETTHPLTKNFVATQAALKIYRRQGERLPMPLGAPRDSTPMRPTGVLPNRALAAGMLMFPTKEAPRQRTSLEKLGALVFNLPVGVVVVDRRYDIQIINSLAHALLGIHRSSHGEDLLHLVDNVPTKPLRALIDAAFRGVEPPATGQTLPMDDEAGTQRWLQIIGYPQQFEADDGPISSVLLLVTDVTNAQRPQQEVVVADPPQTLASAHVVGDQADLVKQQQERIQALTTQLQRLVHANEELREANQELTSTNIGLYQASEEHLVNTEEIQAAAEEVETFNEELQATNEELETLNEELQATVEELNATNDDLEARSVDLQELAREREELRRLSESERTQLDAILVGMSDAVLVVDNAGQTRRVNPAYIAYFGDGSVPFPPLDHNGQAMAADMTPQQRAARGETFSLTFTLYAPDGARRWFEANGQPLEQVGVAVIVIRDITDRSLRRLQDEFLLQASHELRTPLTSAQTSLQIQLALLNSSQESDRVRHFADVALHQVRRLSALIDDLTDLSRLQTGKLNLQMQAINLVRAVTRAVEAIQLSVPEKPITLEADAPEYAIVGDPLRLEQVVINLLTNALRYAEESPSIAVRLRRVDNAVELQVQDYGPGIAASELPNLFSRFYRVAHDPGQFHQGLGLGLFITQEIVTAHGGQVAVHSEEGQGATFTVTLPLAKR